MKLASDWCPLMWRFTDAGPVKVVRRTRGPAYANLQGRKPREVWQGGALDAMGISVQTVCCRSPLNACLGSDRAGDEPSGWIAIGRMWIGVGSGRRSTS